MDMELSKYEVKDVVLNNDIARAAEMLEGFGFNEDGLTDRYTAASRELATCILCYMSAVDLNGDLTDEFAQEIVARVGSYVLVFDLVRAVIVGAKISVSDLGCLNDTLRAVFYDDSPRDAVAAIEALGAEEFKALLVLFTWEIRMPKTVGVAVLKKIHECNLIPSYQLYSLMAAYLCMPSSDSAAFFPSLFGAMDLLGFFGSPLSSDDEEEKKCDNDEKTDEDLSFDFDED